MIRTIVWGCGQFGMNAFSAISNLSDHRIIAICDSNIERVGTLFNGIKISSPETALKQDDFEILVLCADKWEEMYLKAKEYGIDDDKIFCWKNGIIRKEDAYSFSVHSQDGEELFLREKFASKQNGIYVDVGAHHPIRFSNTLWAHELGWKGVNIEPDYENFRLFKIMRPNDININAGISDVEGELDFYRFEESALNTFDKSYADYISNSSGYRIKDIVKVPVVPLQTILEENKIFHIDFLDIDVEEHEMEVLSSVRFDKVDVELILVEQLNSNLKNILNSGIAEYLKQYGYIASNKFDRTVVYERID